MPYHTVIPLSGFPPEWRGQVEFGDGFVLGPVPEWVRADSMLKNLNKWDQQRVDTANVAFATRYDASALGDPDPNWPGPNPRAIQETKYETGLLANLSLWLARPSPVNFTVVVHGPEYPSGPVAQRVTAHSPLLCHPKDVKPLTKDDLIVAARLHSSLVSTGRTTAMWTAIRSVWSGLQMNSEPVRCILFWVALEAMFGPEDGREITFRLSQRFALFMGKSKDEMRNLSATAKRGYAFRSKLVHGRWKQDSNSTDRMAEAEDMVRSAFVRILLDPSMVDLFSGNDREAFLDELAFLAARHNTRMEPTRC